VPQPAGVPVGELPSAPAEPDPWRRRGTVVVGAFTIAGVVITVVGTFFLRSEQATPPQAANDVSARRGEGKWRGVEGVGVGESVALKTAVPNLGGSALEGVRVNFEAPDGIELEAESCHLFVGDKESGDCRQVPDGIEAEIARIGEGRKLKVFVHAALRDATVEGRQRITVVADSEQTPPEADHLALFPEATHDQAAVRELFRSMLDGPLNFHSKTAERSRGSEVLMANEWDQLDPGRLHDFEAIETEARTSIGALLNEREPPSLLVTIAAEVVRKPIEIARNRGRGGEERVTELVEAAATAQASARAWCVTKRPAKDKLEDGDSVRLRAIPMIWGKVSPGEDEFATVLLACPAIRVEKGPSQGS